MFDLERIGAGLPVAGAADALREAARSGAMVVTAPPGTGKTTFVPPLAANLVAGSVLVTQPRRVAVRAAARRIAQLDGTPLGERVGFTVRGERTLGPSARIEMLTPGVLLRRLIDDPGLTGIGAVILDEVHERSLDGDLLLGMLAEVRALRPDLLVVAMSATLDAGAVSALLGDAPVVDVPSPLHPLSVDYAPPPSARLDERGLTRDFLTHLATLTSGAEGALVFVPSARDVDQLVSLLRARGDDVLPLHGRLPAREQDRATGGGAAIVVSTALAESSLTVPGVRLVVDAGLSREVRRDQARDMTGLVTVSASRASAEQRAGRAARVGPGRAIRAYTEADFARMPAASPPEIASADLVDAALMLGAWGTTAGCGLALLTAPPREAMARAIQVLHELQLTDAEGRPTDLGRRVATLPVGARQARALLDGAARVGSALAAEVVAAMSGGEHAEGADLRRLLRDGGAWRREVRRLRQIADANQGDPASEGRIRADSSLVGEISLTGVVAALARPDWVAKHAGSRAYLLASGTRAALPEGSDLAGHEWLAVCEVQRAAGRAADGTGAVIRLAAPLDEECALEVAADLLTEERVARVVSGEVRMRLERRLGAITLASTPTAARPSDIAPALAAHLGEVGLDALPWSDGARSLRARMTLLHRVLGEPWPSVDDDALLAHLDLSRGLSRVDITSALRALLPWPEASRLDDLTPERLAVPSGHTAAIDYTGDRPLVAVKLQEMFGQQQTPRLVDGRVPVLFHLLSPARRPLAVTDDLASFWAGPYQDARKQMRGRYPKHPWPEDPLTAIPTAHTKR
ncbi:MAG: ATP-dependent helicase HrpB [Microbacterium sp.]